MKKEDFISTFVMTTVSILMLVGVTIAWYTAVYAHPTVTNMQMTAKQRGSIKIAVTSGGEDIAELTGESKLATMGLEELQNIVNGQMAPGAYGEVTFYVTSLDKDITECQVIPSFVPVYETTTSEDGTIQTVLTKEEQIKMNEFLETHFDFYADEEMTELVSATNPMLVTGLDENWNETDSVGEEKTVTIYWKWHYEYPFTEEEKTNLTEEEKEEKIYQYDMEDTKIGNCLDTMSFHFEFMAQ